MKKRKKSFSKNLKPAKLFLDEIRDIQIELAEYGSELEILTEDYELDSLQELSELYDEKVTTLTLITRNPYISVDFKKDDIRIYCRDINQNSRRTLEAIEEIIDSHRRIIVWILHSGWFFFSLFFILETLFEISLDSNKHFMILISSAAIVYGLYYLIHFYGDKLIPYSLIILKYRETPSSSFIRRNFNRIIVGLLAVALGSAATYLIIAYLK